MPIAIRTGRAIRHGQTDGVLIGRPEEGLAFLRRNIHVALDGFVVVDTHTHRHRLNRLIRTELGRYTWQPTEGDRLVIRRNHGARLANGDVLELGPCEVDLHRRVLRAEHATRVEDGEKMRGRCRSGSSDWSSPTARCCHGSASVFWKVRALFPATGAMR